jgi:hypothetical protein
MGQGLAYQRKFSRLLEKEAPKRGWTAVLIEPWIKFEDANGEGWASPDAVLVRPGHFAVFEVKLSWTPAAAEELQLLYAPLCRYVWEGCTTRLVEVFRNPGDGDWGSGSRIDSLAEMPLVLCAEHEVVSWHWLSL